MAAYYNEIDPYAAQWLRNLIAAGHIADGVVDDRSIKEVTPDEVRGFTQCHFFAGIGVWSYALRCAGWNDDRPVWTGSCPCQPFSVAGRGKGEADARHLWPELFRLASECRPGVILGEQVAGSAGAAWLDLVFADMEGIDYACGAVVASAAGVGAPHIRRRLYWVAHADGGRREVAHQSSIGRNTEDGIRTSGVARVRESSGVLANADNAGLEGRGGSASGADQCAARSSGVAGGMADSTDERWIGQRLRVLKGRPREAGMEVGRGGEDVRAAPTDGYWRDADWIYCRDDKWRPVESGTFPLVDGSAGRVGRLRAYGNAIVAPLAAEFIGAVMDCLP